MSPAERMAQLLADRCSDGAPADAVPGERSRRQSPGHTLTRDFYTDPDFHRLDLEHVWYREWIFLAHTCELPQPGDYVSVQLGDYPLLILRGADHIVRAFHNVCRHRGSVLCEQERGTVRRRIVCPYHQWSYELDGRLAKSRDTGPLFDASDHGLAEAACEVVGGMVFVALAASPSAFDPVRSVFGRYLAPFDPESARVAHTDTVVERGCWKLVMENNRECFHCRTAHPELCVTFPEGPMHSGGGDPTDVAKLRALVESCEALGLPSTFVASEDFQFRAMRMPFNGDHHSMTLNGAPAVNKTFAQLPAHNIGDVLLYHYPNTWNHYAADHAVTFRILPVGPMQTQLTTTWLVPHDAVEGVDYDVNNLIAVWNATNAQDTVLVERAQRGVLSPAFRPGPYSPVEEEGVVQFLHWYANTMRSRLGRVGETGDRTDG